MIPGNPGVSAAYVHWFKCLVSSFVDSNKKAVSSSVDDEKDNNHTHTTGNLCEYHKMVVYIFSHANHTSDCANQNQGKV